MSTKNVEIELCFASDLTSAELDNLSTHTEVECGLYVMNCSCETKHISINYVILPYPIQFYSRIPGEPAHPDIFVIGLS